jgi:integrase
MSRRLDIGDVGEIQLLKSDTGMWKARAYFRDLTGKRRGVRGSGTSQRAARSDLMARVEKALESPNAMQAHMMTFATAGDAWLATIDEKVTQGLRAEGTHECYSNFWNLHIRPALGELKISELTPSILDRFLVDLRNSKSYSIAKTSRSVLSGICGYLVRRDLIPVNYVRDVGRLEQGRRKQPRALTPGELREWLNILDASEHAQRKDLPDLVRLLLGTGLRIGEGLALTWEDVDLETRIVVAEWKVVRIKGKGIQRRRTKTSASDRTLALPRWCCDMLQSRTVPKGLSDPIFPSTVGTWRDRSNVGRDLRKIRAGTAVDWFVSHTARRTVATAMDHAGLTARSIADQLGHSRVSMTQDFYLGRKIISRAGADALDALMDIVVLPEPPTRGRHMVVNHTSTVKQTSNPLPCK